jgi:hypothetical protein
VFLLTGNRICAQHGLFYHDNNNMIETVGVLKLLDSIWQDSDLLPMRTHYVPFFCFTNPVP